MATRRNAENMAIPLCLPDNCQWIAATGEYIKTGERRSALYVVDEALQKLRTVRGKKILSLVYWKMHFVIMRASSAPNVGISVNQLVY